jgi:DMSO/TMAO reductase YedYZ molybdopterin-dependent catalytic subunit
MERLMDKTSPLPPGQYEIEEFPRFGLPQFADRLPTALDPCALKLRGDVQRPGYVTPQDLARLPRVEQTSDFHCVTTWSRRGLRWSGFRFRDFYEHILTPHAQPDPQARLVVFRCLDGYAVSLPLSDVLADDVLLADTLDGEPLSREHGAPLRLVAPGHYGYKNPKHLRGIELRRDDRGYRFATLRFMDHPRARVAFEERGRGFPGWLLRYLYRPLIKPTIRQFKHELRVDAKENAA